MTDRRRVSEPTVQELAAGFVRTIRQLDGIPVNRSVPMVRSSSPGGVDTQGATVAAGWMSKTAVGAALPLCDASARGMMRLKLGGAGVADTRWQCQKLADDSYDWVEF